MEQPVHRSDGIGPPSSLRSPPVFCREQFEWPKRDLLTGHSRHCFDKTPVQALRSATWHAKPRKRASDGPAIA
jgi:hypothetical protein